MWGFDFEAILNTLEREESVPKYACCIDLEIERVILHPIKKTNTADLEAEDIEFEEVD